MQDWDVRVSDFDKDNETSSQAVVLDVPYHLSEGLIYGKRKGGNKYWEGEINLWPGHTHVVELKRKTSLPAMYGVWIEIIEQFWHCPEGVHVLYGVDKKIYANPGSDGGDIEGNWEVFWVEGGWNPREFSSEREIDQYEFREYY